MVILLPENWHQKLAPVNWYQFLVPFSRRRTTRRRRWRRLGTV